MNKLESLRKEIRHIDEKIFQLVRERIEAAKRIGEIKTERKEPLQNFEVEKGVVDHALGEALRLGIQEETARNLIRTLIEASLHAQERDEGRRVPPSGRTALVVGGAGLMGNWFCRFLTEEGYQVYVDDLRPNPKYPSGKPGERSYDLVLLAAPPSALPGLVDQIGSKLSGETLLLDIGSVKGSLVAKLKGLARSGKKVASLHPMFGPKTEVLMGKNVLVLDAGHAEARSEAKRLFNPTTAQTFELPLEEHDARMAEVLGLAHAANIAFSAALAESRYPFPELERLASTTFRKQTDVAREVSRENPKLYYEIQALNPASDQVLARLERSVRTLRRIVKQRDEAAFVELMFKGRAFYGGS